MTDYKCTITLFDRDYIKWVQAADEHSAQQQALDELEEEFWHKHCSLNALVRTEQE